MKTYLLGPAAQFNQFPVEVDLDGNTYYLTRQQDQYVLLSTICPHMNGQVYHNTVKNCFECPVHHWTFDVDTGQCLNNKHKQLQSFHVYSKDDLLYAQLPERKTSDKPRKRASMKAGPALDIELHSHACLEFRHQGYSLLADPWLEGPAFLGAWIPYPAPVVTVKDLQPDALWISHEHSDHFHEPTLRKIDRSVPVYVPDFPNRRMVDRLRQLGFQQVIPTPFGQPIRLNEHMTITSYEPSSLWNDAILLIEVDGFRILNLNDAGLNYKIAAEIGPVDVVASGFSPGASGYPLTWNHLDEQEKITLMQKSCHGIIEMLKAAVHLYGAQYLLPMASHFRLWHPDHQKYEQLSQKNTIDDIVQSFQGSACRVIDLLPGESWNTQTGQIQRLTYDRSVLYDKTYETAYLQRAFREEEFQPFHPQHQDLTLSEIRQYFLRLNEVPEMVFSEDLTMTIEATTEGESIHMSFEIKHGELRILDEIIGNPNITMKIPSAVLAEVIRSDLSWDEATIGYWCEFTRDPDIYHGDFWRLLQAPYYKKKSGVGDKSDRSRLIDEHSIIAEIVEKYGDEAVRIMHRYGLYCLGCSQSMHESLKQGAQSHGVEPQKIERMITELNTVLKSRDIGMLQQ